MSSTDFEGLVVAADSDHGALRGNAENLRQWLHRIDEASIKGRAFDDVLASINEAAIQALKGEPAPYGPSLIPSVIVKAQEFGAPTSIGRPELAECFDLLEHVEKALEALPYRVAVAALSNLGAIREHLSGAFPGGLAGKCDYCEELIGYDEIGASDPEGGGNACKACVAKDPTHFRKGGEAADWIEWPGGKCPVPGETLVDVRYRNPSAEGSGTPLPSGMRADHYHWKNNGFPLDIVAYRVIEPGAETPPPEQLVIRVDGSYRTRNGKKMTVEWVDERTLIGRIAKSPNWEIWYVSGRFFDGREHELDLVAPWVEPADFDTVAAAEGERPEPDTESERLAFGAADAAAKPDEPEPDTETFRSFGTADTAAGWVEWNGGDCPIPSDVEYFIRFRDGDEAGPLAGEWATRLRWINDGGNGDFVAYRLVKAPEVSPAPQQEEAATQDDDLPF